jgi:hypothetical protein
VILTLGLGTIALAAEPLGPEQARQAVERALPMLLEGGDGSPKAEVKGQGCISCHWGGTALFSLTLSQRVGLVDRKELGRFDNLLKKQSTKKLIYQINGAAWELVKNASAPAEKKAEVQKFNGRKFNTPAELKKELEKVLPAKAVEKNFDEIVKKAANPNYYDTAARFQSAWLLISGAAANGPAPADTAAKLVRQLLELQDEDGSFFEAGQPFFPCEAKEQRECYTIWALLALHTLNAKTDAVAAAIGRGQAFLKKTKPGQSLVAVALRTLLAYCTNDAKAAGESAAVLLKRQKTDGGWSIWDWSKGNYESDAWATGFVLYTLGRLDRDHSDAAVQKAWAFLISSQGESGEWTVTNAKGKQARIWSLWGTGWAVNGLLATSAKK